MKKILSIILILALALSFAACGKKATIEITEESDAVVETDKTETESAELSDKEETSDDKKEEVAETKPEAKPEAKPETKPEAKPEAKPETKPEAKPETKPETKPEVKPEAKPETKPEPTPEKEPEKAPENLTLGNTLLAAFKEKAQSGMDTISIAEALITNPAIKFSGGAMPIEEGLLSGFGNTEIKGFKSGAMFAPMIGSIPFVGYVFELSDGTNASSFISTLKSNADLRWNICVAADEMVSGSVGNKVFFVMCPTSLED